MRRKILIVDDSAVNRQILHKILGADYHVLDAENGREALDILQRGADNIDAVLLDIIMPVMDGYAVLRTMRADAALSKVPVIVTTGSSDEATEVKALSLGANDFLLKPYKPTVIKQRLENTINLREAAAVVTAVEKDGLTGVYSKAFFYSKAEALLHATAGTRYDILCCDIERFHLVNELFGTRTGDALLKRVAELIVEYMGEGGLCGRIGPNQFGCMVLHHERYDATDFAAAVEAVNAFPISMDISIKCGICAAEDLCIPVSVMCDRAMAACNSIKGQSGTYFAYYSDDFRQKALSEQYILDGMEAGLAEGQFIVYYQPKYRIASGEMTGAEALVRWNHPTQGLLAPSAFIPLFEKNGLITDLDLYVWETVCRDIREWHEAGHKPMPISVNVSRADIYHPDLPELLVGLVHKYGLSPDMLHLEITEAAYTEDGEQLVQALLQLKALGFFIEMDDFGAAYSSLHALSGLPINVLKLESCFTQAGADNANKNGVLDCVIELTRRLHLPVIAECVETEEQAQRLGAFGCGYAQGFYFGRPMPREEFETRLP